MFNKIKSVEPLQNFILKITFEKNTVKYYDIKPLFIKFEIFNLLKNNYILFNKVKVDPGGYGISWNDEIDLSCNELWINGKNEI